MPFELGASLVAHGLLSAAELQEALQAQLLWGGRLGTNLVELGFINEDALATFIAEQLAIPCADQEDFDQISADVAQCLPRTMVEKHRIVPLACGGGQLLLAMRDPTDADVLAEVVAATRASVSPAVSTELLLLYAMEQLYGVPRGTRYLQLAAASGALDDATAAAALPPFDRTDLKQKSYSLKHAVAELCEARRQHDIFEVLRRFVRMHFEQVAVFVLTGKDIVGWMQSGCRLSDHEMRQLALPMAESSLFGGGECRAPYIGPVPSSDGDARLFRALGIATDRDVFLLPLVANKRTIAALLISGPLVGEISDRVLLFDNVTTKTGYAFQMLYLQHKIRGESAF